MYSSRDVDGDILQSLSPSETIPPDVPPHFNQPYRHHSASWPANVSSNSATIHRNGSTASVSHQRSKPWRLPGLRSFANITGKIPLFRRAPHQASENRVTTSARPSRKEHHLVDSPSSPILGTTSHDRGGQASVGADHAQNVAERPVSSSKSYNIFSSRLYRRKQQLTISHPSPSHPPTIPPPPPGLLSRRALQEVVSDARLRPGSKEPGEQNQAPLPRRTHSPHKHGVIRPCPQQDDRIPSGQPSDRTSTYPHASLNYPGVSASPSSSRPAQPLRRTYVPQGPLPEKPKASLVEVPSKLTRFSNEGEGRVPPSEHDPENPSGTINDQVHTDPPREPKEGPSSSGNDPQVVAYATADASATFSDCHEPPEISRHKRLRNVQRTSPEKCKTLVRSHNVWDLDDGDEDVITNQSEEDNCEVFVDAHSGSDDSPRSPKSISKRSFSTASMIDTGSSENGPG